MTLDPTTRAVLEVIHQAGFTTTVVRLDGIYHVTATDPAGERWRVRPPGGGRIESVGKLAQFDVIGPSMAQSRPLASAPA